jgi:hypothetical protein
LLISALIFIVSLPFVISYHRFVIFSLDQKPGTATAATATAAGGKAVPASAQQSVSPPRAPSQLSQTTTAQQAQSLSPQRTTSALGGESGDAKDEIISKLKHTNASLRLRLKVRFS